MNKKGFFSSLSLRERINFTRNLAIVVKASVPLVEGLTLIKKQTNSKTLVHVIDELIANVNNGKYLSDSFGGYKHIFGDFFMSILRVGETSGTLHSSLVYLAEEMEKASDLKGKIRSASIYPTVIFSVTIGVVAFLVFYIFPKLMSVFDNLNVELPLPTKILIAGSAFIFQYGLYVLGGFIVVFIILKILYAKFEIVRYLLNSFTLALPLVGPLIKNVNAANFSRVLGVLLKSGVQIVDAVTVTSKTFDNAVYKRAVFAATDEIRKGEQLADYLAKFPKLFPTLFTGLIGMGESTGNLEENLVYLSDYYTKEVDYKVKNMTTVLEPALLLFMGLIIGFVAISIIQTIYQTTTSINSF